ncbi:RICIN domain-containing protein [Streptomyces sp. NBC_00090]|uniref:RICIN domain-containing protein n=1 Tax=Streptomyces sp. NBC_00090 TaxID=2903619 RepID=UPI0032435B2C
MAGRDPRTLFSTNGRSVATAEAFTNRQAQRELVGAALAEHLRVVAEPSTWRTWSAPGTTSSTVISVKPWSSSSLPTAPRARLRRRSGREVARCRYATDWTATKLRWSLGAAQIEVDALQTLATEPVTWDSVARTATVTLVSDISQSLDFVCRRGIASLSTAAPVAASPLGDHARKLTLTAGTRTQITVGMLSGSYRVVNRASGKVLDVANESTGNGAAVIQWPWTGGANQQWRLRPDYDGSFRLANVHSGKVLDNPGTSMTSGHALDQWTDTDSPNQWWKLVPSGTSGHYHLVNVASGLYAGVENASADDGARILQLSADGSAGQEWTIVSL